MKEAAAQEAIFLSRLYNHQGILHKICLAYTDNTNDREDLYQEMVLQLWKSYPSFQERSAFSTWMYRVALNTAISMVKKKRHPAGSEISAEIPYDPEPERGLSEEIRILYQAIGKLDKIEKAIILLWLEEKSYEEIAETVGISVKNVSVRLVRIKQKLTTLVTKITSR